MGINISVLGSPSRIDFCKNLAKKGATDDFTFYQTSYKGKIITLIEPTRYPKKIKALIDTISLTDYVIFIIDELTPDIGEQIVVLDLLNLNGLIITDLDITPYIKGTNLSTWDIVTNEEARIRIMEDIKPIESTGAPVVFVDHAFEVKGIGTVVLGIIKQGEVKVHDKLILYPQDKEFEIRSIQRNDVTVKQAETSDRVGLAIKKLGNIPISRGNVISNNKLKTVSELTGNLIKAKHAKDDSDTLTLYHCLQSVPVKKENGKFTLETPIAKYENEPLILCDLNAKIRIIGKLEQ